MATHKEKSKLSDLIQANTTFQVLPMTQEIKQEIEPFIKQAIENYNAGPVFIGRPNEFGNHMEDVLRKTSTKFSKPTKSNGNKQSTGYPDLKFDSTSVLVYTEVKTFKKDSDNSDMRSFYLSSFDKITSDAVHVVVGFEHHEMVLTGNYHIVDMANKVLTVKVEHACSNKELYK
jgi:hypothetical protein